MTVYVCKKCGSKWRSDVLLNDEGICIKCLDKGVWTAIKDERGKA